MDQVKSKRPVVVRTGGLGNFKGQNLAVEKGRVYWSGHGLVVVSIWSAILYLVDYKGRKISASNHSRVERTVLVNSVEMTM